MVSRDVAVREDSQLALQELESRFVMATRQRELLESYIKARLKPNHHFYQAGDDPKRKPSLTKEGAELICLPHVLKPRYHWLFGPETPPFDEAPYQITIKCELEAGGKFAGEGIGSASSMLTRKDGERVQRQNDPGLRHNATLKMASKSAYIAATLNATAASEFFTQDLEDNQEGDSLAKTEANKDHWCEEHQTFWFKKGKMTSYAHPIAGADGENTGKWCHEHKKPPQSASPSPSGDVSPPPSDTQATTPAARLSSDGGQPGETRSQAQQQPQPVASTAQGGTKPQSAVAASARAPQDKPPTDETPTEPVVFRTWGEVAAACANLGVTANQVFARAGVESGKRFLSWLEMDKGGWSFAKAWALAQEINKGAQ